MSDREIQHTEAATGRPYEALVEAFERELGHLDPLMGARLIEQKASWSEVEREMARMAGPRGLMIIFKADQGRIASLSGQERQCLLYLVGKSRDRGPDYQHRFAREFLCAVPGVHL
jgi:hypothetical protein